MNTKKTKSAKRFETLNAIVDKLLRRLPARHGLAVLVCFRHADVNRRFRMSAKDLAKTLGIHLRSARSLLSDLQEWEVIRVVSPQQGTIPRTFELTGKLAREGVSPHTKPKASVRADVP
jgi:hypothetical protein